MTPSWSVRPAVPADALPLAELHAEAVRPDLQRLGRWDHRAVRRRFLDEFAVHEAVTVVGGGSDLLGSFALHRDAPVAAGGGLWLRDLHLAPEARGRGIGSALLDEVARATSGEPLSAVVLAGSRAGSFFRRHGFVELVAGDVDAVLHRPSRQAAAA